MIIHAVFANRKYDPEVIELVTAWDEFSVDENPEGWEEEVNKGLASWGEYLLHHVHVDIKVSDDVIEKEFRTLQVQGEVTIQ